MKKPKLFVVACYLDHEIEENDYAIYDDLKFAKKEFKRLCKLKCFQYIFLAPIKIGKGFNCIDAIDEWANVPTKVRI
jgi:hypothetical protein